ncbi:hypothetical protein C8R45DRAFT_932013 [Mycena sanguinolenta]|nr:hypothetical protein C8R45DRAFT_932013 [Mycena sanguinolenta]
MILRPLFLRAEIRNASGNGGGELAGFMVRVQDRKHPADRSHAEKIRFAKFKRDVYHRVLRIIFVETLQRHASGGKCVTCGDNVNRVLFPRLPVFSLDGEEACTCAATRGSLADFPCPRCLVCHNQLHDFFSKNWSSHYEQQRQGERSTSKPNASASRAMQKIYFNGTDFIPPRMPSGRCAVQIHMKLSRMILCTLMTAENEESTSSCSSKRFLQHLGSKSWLDIEKRKHIYQEEDRKNCIMTDLDAMREGMAHIRMTLNQYDAGISERIGQLAEHADVNPNDIQEVDDAPDEDHLQLGDKWARNLGWKRANQPKL